MFSMRVVAELVVDDKGRPSVWLEDARTSAMLYASRVHGLMSALVTGWEARQMAKEAYERGLRGEPYEEPKID
jgi:hypothetical protein